MAARNSRRGHPARYIDLASADRRDLEKLVGDGRTEQRWSRRARVLLAMSRPETVVRELAVWVEMRSQGIWDLCRRYEERGIEAVFDAPRSGCPRNFSPLGARPD